MPHPDPRVAVRTATRADVPAIAAMHLASWRAAYTAITPAGFMQAVTLRSRVIRWERAFAPAVAGRTETTVAKDAERILGVCSFGPRGQPESPAAGEIYSLHVSPDSWGQGLGRMLLDDALRRLRARGFADAVLWVLRENLNARGFYEARGWSPTGEERNGDRSGYDIPEVRYSIILATEP